MKRTLLLIIPVFLLFSCKKDNSVPKVETTTRGSKWNLKIGSSGPAVYAQLQQLGKEKSIADVAVIKQQLILNPEEIQHRLAFYNAVSLETTTGTLDRAIIQFNQDNIGFIFAGGALPDEVTKWPQNAPDDATIKKNDPLSGLYNKLLAIYQIPTYKNNYKIILPDKPLNKPFDPDMVNHDEWIFNFFVDVKPGKSGRYTVSLFFKDGKLIIIKSVYEEFDVYE